MMGNPSLRAVVVGAGVAGLLACRALEEQGVRVTLLRGRKSGEGRQLPAPHRHIRVLPAASVEAVRRLLPDLGDALGRAWGVFPDQTALDGVLEAACLTGVTRVTDSRFRWAAWTDAGPGGTLGRRGLKVVVGEGEEIPADLLVDASGIFRATFPAVAAAMEGPVPLDEIRGGSRYTSFTLGLAAEHGGAWSPGVFRALRRPALGLGLLLLGLGEGRLRVTLQTPHRQGIRGLGDIGPMTRALQDPQWDTLLGGAVLEGSLSRWGPHPVTRVALEMCFHAPPGWIPLGDALLVTPPHLAGGLAQAAEQVELMVRGLAQGDSPQTLRQRLGESARGRWVEAALTGGLWGEGKAVPAGDGTSSPLMT